MLSVQAGGLDVEADDLAVKGGGSLPVNGNPIVHVVDKVGFHAVEKFDLFGRVPGVWEGLSHPVVGDGDGRVAPGLRPLDHVPVRAQLGPHAGKGIHGGHGGVEVELHPLLRGGVLLHLLLRRSDGHRLQHHVAVEAVHVETALDLDVHPLFDAVHQGLALVAGEEFVYPDGAGVVGHVEGHYPGSPLFQLPIVNGEDVALHHHHAHVQLQLPDGGGGFCDGLAEDGLAFGLFVPLDRGGRPDGIFQGRLSDGFGAGKGIVYLF